MLLPLTKKNSVLMLLFICTLTGLLISCRKKGHLPNVEEDAGVVYDWYKFIAIVQRPANPQPVVILNNRNFGFIGIGMYEAVQPGIKGAVSLSSKLYQMPAMPEPEFNNDYLWSASANAALASMFKQFLAGLSDANKASIDSMENANNNRFKLFISDAVFNRSQAFGSAIAKAIYDWSTTDNFNLGNEGYQIPVFPGSWVPTPPAFAGPVGPFLKDSRPFLAYSLTATAPPLPVPYSEDTASAFYKAAHEVYTIGKNLTAEQKAMTEWWADAGGSGVGVPAPYHILSIITAVTEGRHAKLAQAAEVYAKTGIALKDGGIITFRAKYQYNLLRPITYVRKFIDSTWSSHVVNPPYPDYTSGLAGFYAPVIQVLIREFGDIPVTDNTYSWKGLAPRHYSSLSALLMEAALSRVYAGIHYRFTQLTTIDVGNALGNQIADINFTSHKNK